MLERPLTRLSPLFSIVIFLFRSTAGAQVADPLPGLDAYIERARQDWGVVGLAVAVVKNDSIILAKGFGLREVNKPDKVDEKTLFAIGSNTKSFTALAIGMLQDEGKLRLDDRVIRHVPGLVLSDPYRTGELTIRDLLSHRTGMAGPDALWNGSGFSREEILHRLASLPVSTDLRSTFEYNNVMFSIAGDVVGRVSGIGWDAYVKKHILVPLRMTMSNTSIRDLNGPNVATPHKLVSGKPVAIRYHDVDNIAGAGAINSNAHDMAEYLRFQLRDGRSSGGQLVSKRFHDEMQAPQMITRTVRDPFLPMVHFFSYGLGLRVWDYYGKTMVSHSGAIDGMLSSMAWIPEIDAGVIVLTNTDNQELRTALTYRILDQLLGAAPRDWSAEFLARDRASQRQVDSLQMAVRAQRVLGPRPSLALDRYVGAYEHPMFGTVRVEFEDNALVLRRSAELSGAMEHWHYDTFAVKWTTSRAPGYTFAQFKLDERARVVSLELRGPPFGQGATFTRALR